MAHSGTGGGDPEAAAESQRAGGPVGDLEGEWKEEQERITRRFPKSRVTRAERERMMTEARTVTFNIAVRGYDRHAVDRYVQEVNRLIAELEISSSSESAVSHALAEVGEETREILQRAHETADEVILRARAKAADALQEAEREALDVRNTAQREAIEARELAAREADELLASARREVDALREAAAREATELQDKAGREAEQVRMAATAEAEKLLGAANKRADQLLKATESRARQLADSAGLIWRERRRMIEDVRVVGEQLLALGEAESQRFPRPATGAELTSGDSGELHSTDATLQSAIEDTLPVAEAT